MHAGEFDHRINILRAVMTTNIYNESIPSWSVYASLWAKRIDASAGESIRAAQVSAEITAHYVIRYSPEAATITANDRVTLEDGLTYDITGVRELQRNAYLELHVVARADDL
jgi:SPP1 family predicted phage head-tail adaptor